MLRGVAYDFTFALLASRVLPANVDTHEVGVVVLSAVILAWLAGDGTRAERCVLIMDVVTTRSVILVPEVIVGVLCSRSVLVARAKLFASAFWTKCRTESLKG